jgi:hypothetical protein
MQKPNVILHIGAEKTGSTSIQKFLSQSQQHLSEQIGVPSEVDLPDTFQGRHAGLIKASGCLWFWRDNPFEKRTSCIREKYRQDYFKRVTALADRCARDGCKHIILSEENLSSRLKYNEIDCITNELNSIFDKKTIIMLMREQFSAYISQYSTFILNGKSDSLKKFLIDHQYSDYFNYYEIVKKWEACGWDVKLDLYSSDVINSFFNLVSQITGESLSYSSSSSGENISLKYPELVFLRYFNKFPYLKKPIFRRFKFAGLKIARNINCTPNYFQKFSDIQKEISDYYAYGNSILAQRFFNRERLF